MSSLTRSLVAIVCLAAIPVAGRAQVSELLLESDKPGVAVHTDPNLVNAWGMSAIGTGAIWVSDNGSGLATLYNGQGVAQSLVVTVPGPAGSLPGFVASPTGQVSNTTSSFGGAKFIFATEDGTISAWNPAVNATNAILEVDNSGGGSGAVYKGLASGNNGSGNFLYAANFRSGNIDVFDSSFHAATLAGSFTDPSAPTGYAPFNVQNIGGQLYVTYALQDGAKHDDVAGAGNGFVDVYDLNGNLVKRLASGTSAGGSLTQLNSPWGLAIAPQGLGSFAGDLLVGNFGSGNIDAFSLTTDGFQGEVADTSGNPLAIDGLWGLRTGAGGNGGPLDTVFFTAGPDGETHGLFGVLQGTPEPGTYTTFAAGALAGIGMLVRRRRSRRASNAAIR